MKVYRNIMTWPNCTAARTKDSYTKMSATENYPPSSPCPLKMLCWNPSESLKFGEHKSPNSLHGPAMNLSLLQTLMFWFVWPHSALGTWTCCWEYELGNSISFSEPSDLEIGLKPKECLIWVVNLWKTLNDLNTFFRVM